MTLIAARRAVGDHAGVRGGGLPRRDPARRHHPAHQRADDLLSWCCGTRTSPTTDVSTVRTLSYGGAPIAPELVHRLHGGVPDGRVGNGFGLTRDLGAGDLPAARVRRHARRRGRLPDAGQRRADRPTGPGDRRRRAAGARARTSSPGTGATRSGRRRRSSTAGCTPATWPASTRGHRADRRPREGHDQPRRRERVLASRWRTRWPRTPTSSRSRWSGSPDPMMGEKVGRRRPAPAGGDRRGPGALADRLRPRPAGRLQGAAVHPRAHGAAAPQRRRQGAQEPAAPADRVDPVPRPSSPGRGIQERVPACRCDRTARSGPRGRGEGS